MLRYLSVILESERRRRFSALAATVAAPAALVFAAGAGADPGAVAEQAGPAPEGIVAPVANAPAPRLLPPGDAPESGLQVKTILAARSVSDAFPEITTMDGVRPDAKPWHPSGRAVDIMIPNPGSSEGIALGDAIRDFALANAERFALQDVIWRGTYYTPEGPRGSGYGHYDHVHITTHGGGFPSDAEEYRAP